MNVRNYCACRINGLNSMDPFCFGMAYRFRNVKSIAQTSSAMIFQSLSRRDCRVGNECDIRTKARHARIIIREEEARNFIFMCIDRFNPSQRRQSLRQSSDVIHEEFEITLVMRPVKLHAIIRACEL